MSRADLDEAFRLIEEHRDDADFEGEKPQALIARAEAALGLKFPPTFRHFLQRLGCGSIAGMEIYGLIDDDFEHSGVPDAVWLTLRERQMSDLPHGLILIGDTGDGDYFAMDTSSCDESAECPVVQWSPADDDAPVIWQDFGAFLRQQVEDAVAS